MPKIFIDFLNLLPKMLGDFTLFKRFSPVETTNIKVNWHSILYFFPKNRLELHPLLNLSFTHRCFGKNKILNCN
ncbi:hypothetical protein NTHiID20_02590 [Haemophilus influenzae]|nr:hypothetical protein CHBNII6_04580 [Haemophilus influenzae]BBF11969.1 hypothetical protein CHBNV1_05430 [Haemophilus influenzae]GBK80542.1 hypothetical protein NTHiID11_08230 [Haemophilus influenzae]GBK92190.1 hypothetical protein NTHiID20_02590 [Haemophilus influenzae]